MKSNPDKFIDSATRSVKWSGLMEILSRIITPVIYIILAKLLGPKDFGIAATAIMTVSFSILLLDTGLGKALIQTKEELKKTSDVAFWVSIFLGLIIYLVIFLSAPYLAYFFDSPESLSVIRVLGIQIIFDSLSSVQQALYMREFAFRRLFLVTVGSTIISGIFSISLAYSGYGVWAIVAGSLCGSLIKFILLWVNSTWRPSFRFDIGIFKKFGAFAGWVVGESILAWLFIWGDSFIVGKYMGVETLGIYRMGCMIANMIFGLFFNPLIPVFYSLLCSLNNNIENMFSVFQKLNKILIAISLPAGIGLYFVSPQIELAFFGDKWVGLHTIIGLFGLTLGFTWMVGLNNEVFRAIGRPEMTTKMLFFAALFYFPVFLASAPYGLETFLQCRLAVSLIIGIPLNAFILSRIFHINLLYLWHNSKNTIISSIFMVVVILIYKYNNFKIPYHANGIKELIIIPAIGSATYIFSLFLLDRFFFTDTIKLLKKSMSI